MVRYDTSKRKILDIYNQKEDNKNLVESKTNNINPQPLDNLIFKTRRYLENTGNVSVSSTQNVTNNILQNTILPIGWMYQYEKTFNLKQILFPFIDWGFIVASSVNEDMLPFHETETDTVANYCEVDGDGGLIVKGENSYLTQFTFPESDLVHHHVDATYYEKINRVTVYWTALDRYNTPTNYRIVGGIAYGFSTNQYLPHASDSPGPGGGPPKPGGIDFYAMSGYIWDENLSLVTPYGKIFDVAGNTFTVMGQEGQTQWTWSYVYFTWMQTTTLTENIHRSFDLSQLFSLYVYGILENELDGVWYHELTPSFQNITTSAMSSFESIPVIPGMDEYVIYYDSTKRFKINIQFDAHQSPALFNTPVAWYPDYYKRPNLGFPYTNITAYVNKDGQYKVSERTGFNTFTLTLPPSVTNGSVDPFWIRMSKSTAPAETWKVRFAYGMLKTAIADTPSSSDYYNQVKVYVPETGGYAQFYIIDSSTETIKSMTYWGVAPTSANTNANFKLVAEAKSPLQWKKTTTFNTEKA